MADYLTFSDLQTEIKRAIKAVKTSKDDLVKAMINMVYLNEMLNADDLYPLFWLVDTDDTLASVAPATITAITLADPGVITTSSAHGFVAGDIVSIYNITGTTQLNNRTFRVNTAPTTTTLTLIDLDAGDAIDTTSYTAWSSGGTIHHRGLTLATSGKNVQRLISCKWHDKDFMLEIDPEEIESDNSAMSDSTARPTRFYHRKQFNNAGAEVNQLIWFQAADAAYDLRYWFEKRGAKLTANGDVPLLPPQFHYGIVAGVVARLAESGVQVETPAIWPGIYTGILGAMISFNRKYYQDNDVAYRRKPFMI